MFVVFVWLRTVLLNIDYATSRLQVLLQHEKECLCICVQIVCSVKMKSIVPFFLSYIFMCVLFVFKKKKEKKKGNFYMMQIARFHLTHRHTGITDTNLLMYIAWFCRSMSTSYRLKDPRIMHTSIYKHILCICTNAYSAAFLTETITLNKFSGKVLEISSHVFDQCF